MPFLHQQASMFVWHLNRHVLSVQLIVSLLKILLVQQGYFLAKLHILSTCHPGTPSQFSSVQIVFSSKNAEVYKPRLKHTKAQLQATFS